jgi:hypothetical protein
MNRQTVALVFNPKSDNGKKMIDFMKANMGVINRVYIIEFKDVNKPDVYKWAERASINSLPCLIVKNKMLSGNNEIIGFFKFAIDKATQRREPEINTFHDYNAKIMAENDSDSDSDDMNLKSRLSDMEKKRSSRGISQPIEQPKQQSKRKKKSEMSEAPKFNDDESFLKYASKGDMMDEDNVLVDDPLEQYFNDLADEQGRVLKNRTFK